MTHLLLILDGNQQLRLMVTKSLANTLKREQKLKESGRPYVLQQLSVQEIAGKEVYLPSPQQRGQTFADTVWSSHRCRKKAWGFDAPRKRKSGNGWVNGKVTTWVEHWRVVAASRKLFEKQRLMCSTKG